MSVSGYDERYRHVGRMPFVNTPVTNPGDLSTAGHSWKKMQRTISFRDSIEGKRLDPKDVDIYNGFYVRDNSYLNYRQPDANLLATLEAAGLAEFTDYEARGFIDNGHPYSTESHEVNTSLRRELTYTNSQLVRRYGGPTFVTSPTVASTTANIFKFNDVSVGKTYIPNLPLPLGTQYDLESDGKRAILATAPGVPEVDITQFLAESLQAFPAIPGRALLSMRNLASGGDEWLNMLFGVIPTVGDGLDLAKALLEITKQLQKYRKHAGQFTRRQIQYPQSVKSQIISSSELSDQGYITTGPGLGFDSKFHTGYTGSYSGYRFGGSPTNGGVRVSTELFLSEVREVSFSGSFVYYIPTSPDFFGRLGKYVVELDRVIGLGLDPTSTWQLTPWSWLVDWFFDIRESISLIEMSHDPNLVMNYGYVMESLNRTVVAKSQFQNKYSNSGVSYCSTYTKSAWKRRLRANPYGFVKQTDSGVFDPYRLSVLAALGISRL